MLLTFPTIAVHVSHVMPSLVFLSLPSQLLSLTPSCISLAIPDYTSTVMLFQSSLPHSLALYDTFPSISEYTSTAMPFLSSLSPSLAPYCIFPAYFSLVTPSLSSLLIFLALSYLTCLLFSSHVPNLHRLCYLFIYFFLYSIFSTFNVTFLLIISARYL
ncbi:hypothetical protein E2C01_088110 [Portunus trituberculatus]|uniref:Uncharacterized protein n=1 Tax=Portunus trituberculatus TaxID=210409 RepID=A0A5B7JEI1_PORTR|nr:hypothetical protein [Portunus trituberculatus]